VGGPRRRWSEAVPRGAVVQHPAVLEFVGRGDPGTRPRLHVVQGQPIVAYSSTRVFMKRDAWEMLPLDGILVQWIRPSGETPWAIAMTRAELEDVFGEIQESESWDEARCYHFPQVPPAALSFRVLSAARPSASPSRTVVRRRKQKNRIYGVLANFNTYDVEGASKALADDTWSLPRGDANPGDRLVFWRTLGPNGKRGVVAFGQVTEAPRVRAVPAESHRFWRAPVPSEPHRRVGFTYLQASGLPLWLDEDNTGLLTSLSVSRAQGNKLYKVTDEAWEALWTLASASAPPVQPVAPAAVPAPPPEPVVIEDLAEKVVAHLREYGSATEAELTMMAGGARGYRRLRRYLAKLDAPLRLETTSGGMLWRWGGSP